MKKRIFGRKLSRERDTRRSLFRGLIKALIVHGSIKTTSAKAKAVRPQIDRIITKGKRGGLNDKRLVYGFLGNDRETSDKLFSEVLPTFSGRKSGFTRLVNLPRRRGDAAEIVRLEWSEKMVTSDKVQVTSKKELKKEDKGKVKSSKSVKTKDRRKNEKQK